MRKFLLLLSLFVSVTSFAQTLTISPSTVSKGQQLNILFSGTDLNFSQGSNTSYVYFAQGSDVIYANYVNVYDSNHLTAYFDIPGWTGCGLYDAVIFDQGSSSLHFPNKLTVDCGTTISGYVYNDVDSSGNDSGEPPMSYVLVSIQPGDIYTETDNNGYFIAQVAGGNYTVSVVAPEYYNQSTLPLTYNVNTLIDSNAYVGEFGLYAAPHNDLGVYIYGPNPRAGFNRSYWVNINNAGTTEQNPDIEMELDSNLTLVNCQYPYTSNGHRYTINVPNIQLQPQGYFSFEVELYAAVSSPVGGVATIITKTLNELLPEENTADNIDTSYFNYTNSWDPNDKQVFPAGRGTNNEVLKAETLRYLVRFQNTGNDVAYLVRIEDTLDANLDLSTFKVLGSSHAMDYTMGVNGAITFTFNNINLPDSGTDQAGSNGYVSYSIKTKSGIADNTVISNTAFIYFDFNPAVVTNTTTSNMVTEYSVEIGIDETDASNGLLIYPNPAADVLNIRNEDLKIQEIFIYDVAGKMLHRQIASSSNIKVNVGELTPGSYLLKASIGGEMQTRRFTIIR